MSTNTSTSGYVAPGSAYLFHSTVRSMKDPRPPTILKTEILAPLTASQTDSPPTATSPLGIKRAPFQVNLPRRELCNRCVARFFRDINSVYWLFSAEQLHSILDRLYSGDGTYATPATLCALYAMLALTCESEMQQEWTDVAIRPSVTYLNLAKSLTPALYDDADSDSIRALCLLVSLFHKSYSNGPARANCTRVWLSRPPCVSTQHMCTSVQQSGWRSHWAGMSEMTSRLDMIWESRST
jgi:hypothetical protein